MQKMDLPMDPGIRMGYGRIIYSKGWIFANIMIKG
jgi:hypothetical protein